MDKTTVEIIDEGMFELDLVIGARIVEDESERWFSW